MYCPRCATQNLDDAKFCRACGTDVETVSLALAEPRTFEKQKKKVKKEKTEKSWAERRSAALRDIVQGAILSAASALICAAFGLFLNLPDWLILWTVFFGWMACWGVISLALGIGSFIESSVMSRELGQPVSRVTAPTAEALPEQRFSLEQWEPPASVTELTTEPLGKRQPIPKRIE